MNRIFKVCFNAARNKMMVVNEATSSAQTYKKVATVAVVGALACGSAVAIEINQTTFTINDTVNWTAADDVTINTTNSDYYGVFGYTADVKVNNLTINSKSGGINLQAQSGAPTTNLTITANNVTINNPQKYAALYNGDANSGSTLMLNVSGETNVTGRQLAVAGDDKNVVVNSGTVKANLTKTAILSYGMVNIFAKTIDIATTSEIALDNYKNISLRATEGDLNLTGNSKNRANGKTSLSGENVTVNGSVISLGANGTTDITSEQKTTINGSVEIKDGTVKLDGKSLVVNAADGADALKAEAGTLDVVAARTVIKGDIHTTGTSAFNLNSDLVFEGKTAVVEKLTGDKASFTVTKADQKVSLTNNNKDLTLAGTGDVNDAVGIEGMDKIFDLSGTQEGVKVQMAEGMSSSASSAVLDKNGNLINKQTVTNSILSNTVDIYAGSTLALNRIMMSDLRKRMGDLRVAEDVNGVWARYNGGKFSGARGLENKFNTIEVGADTAALVDGVRLGVAFSYTDSESDMLRGKADMDAFSLAAYGTKFFDNGIYADVIGRIAKADTDVSVDGNKNGKMDNLAVSLSGELGWRFDLSKQVYIEPQTELTFTNIDSDTLKLSSGHEYKFDSVNSLIGRVGVATGIKCPNNKGDVYVRVSAVHEFLGDAKVTTGRVTHEVKGDDTWMEYGLGANFNINKNAYVYTELERSEGAALEQDWRANLGVRIAF